MSKTVKLKKGFTINLAGKAKEELAEVSQPETFAIKPTDFAGMLRPKALVSVGDNVKAGTPVLIDKKLDCIQYTSPVSGEVVDIRRGAKRKLLEIVVLADKDIEYESYKTYNVNDLAAATREDVQDQIVHSGVWPNIMQRPYGVVADPKDTPRDIFISGFDTNPLAPNYNFTLKGQERNFQAGIEVLKKFTAGTIHVNIDGKGEINTVYNGVEGIKINKFTGKHPVGNVGIQIHHLAPINKNDLVWTVNPYGVIQIGRLFLEGKYDASKIIALAGSEVKNPQYYKTYSGACIGRFADNNLTSEHVRYISGNVLTGERIESKGHLGYYDHMFSVIPEGDKLEFFGWMFPSFNKLSFSKSIGSLSFLNSKKKEYVINTNLHGGPRAFVQTGDLEKVLPMDIYPTFLLKAILAEDFDDMEALGIYEIIEEDFALCEFIDVSKHDMQSIIREGLNLMQYS
ncbi:MAG: Na(+)-translocating NADH-quinone reductase subunit A [Bacteroidota bacterium]